MTALELACAAARIVTHLLSDIADNPDLYTSEDIDARVQYINAMMDLQRAHEAVTLAGVSAMLDEHEAVSGE